MGEFNIQVVDKPTSWAWKCEYKGKLYGSVVTTTKKDTITKERVVEIGEKGMERVLAFAKKWGITL